jgi:hypothetical protein
LKGKTVAKKVASKVPAGHRISVIGKGTHEVNDLVLERGQHYMADELGWGEDEMEAANADPNLVVEPIDEDGNLFTGPPQNTAEPAKAKAPKPTTKKAETV